MCSNDAPSSVAPLPRAMARSMLSFGIDASRAFSIAFRRARFASGSGPPSRAATMIARASFEKSWPRRLSVAPLACLIECHLLCPDTCRLLYRVARHGSILVSAFARLRSPGARAAPPPGRASGARPRGRPRLGRDRRRDPQSKPQRRDLRDGLGKAADPVRLRDLEPLGHEPEANGGG